MLRASAKNFLRVLSVCNPADYGNIVDELRANDGYISLDTRFRMAEKSFQHTAEYDKNIFDFLKKSTIREMTDCYEGEKE